MKPLITLCLLIGAALTSTAENLPSISHVNAEPIAIVVPIPPEDEYFAASVATNLTTNLCERFLAIQTLSKNTASHLDVLRILTRDPKLDIQIMAAESLFPIDPAIASSTAKDAIRTLSAHTPESPTANFYGFRAAALLAKLNDPSGFDFVENRLHNSPFVIEKESALGCLPEFRRFPELPVANSIIRFIKATLPDLKQEGSKESLEADRLLAGAFDALYRLQAVETLSQLKEWEPNLPPKTQWILQYYMRGLETYKNMDKFNEITP